MDLDILNKLLGSYEYVLDYKTKDDILIAQNTLKNTVSNSVAIAYDNKVIGVGCGQQNRVDCIKIAGKKAKKYLKRNNIDINNVELVLASDGFLPFEDNVEECLKYNVKYIIQPGGSIRDKEVKILCIKNDIYLINTGHRMFFH